ncbi:MAG: sigma-70 family RNA polymerase sigma factor, partial [Chamaesiphon sp.]|nr:sigma-70 family RNA polymerase sigma factor [Chamaesiphon sp.]
MRSRQSILEIFSTFLCFEDDLVTRWIVDGKLRRSIQTCLGSSREDEASPRFWALYWHQTWQAEAVTDQSSPLGKIATNHLAAYLQEVCYWSAQKIATDLSKKQLISDFFQIAMIKLDRVIKGFKADRGTELKSYASLAFTNAIIDTLRQRQEVEICTDWALLHKVSHKRSIESLQQLGLNPDTIAAYILAWECFKTIYAPTGQGSRKLDKPDLAALNAIADLFNRELGNLSNAPARCDGETIFQWLTTLGAAVRSFLYPTIVSASQPKSASDSSEFLDDFDFTVQESLLTQTIEQEDEIDRDSQRSQLQKILLRALVKFNVESQRLLQMYYGQGLTQQEIASQLATKQYTVSRRLTSVREALLTALCTWSQTTMHKTLDPSVMNDLSLTIEEWLMRHYSHPDLHT